MSNIAQNIYANIMQALDLISQGETPTKACDKAGVSTATLRKYCLQDPVLKELSDEAHQRGHDTMADVLLHIDTDDRYGSTNPQVMRVISDNIKWYLSRKNPQQYGEKVTIENKITADKAIVEALSRGKQRALEGVINKEVAEDVAYQVVDAIDLSEFM